MKKISIWFVIFVTLVFSNYAFSQTPGSVKWTFNMGAQARDAIAPAIGPDGTVYVIYTYYYDGILYAVNPDGTEKWKYNFSIASGAVYPPVIDKIGTIYIRSYEDGDKNLKAINPDGTHKWDLNCRNVWSAPAIASDGRLYAACGSYLYAIDADGTVDWSVNLRRFGTWNTDVGVPVIGADGTIYSAVHVQGGDDFVVAIDPANPTLPKGRFYHDLAPMNELLSLGNDGTVYFCDQAQNLFALNPVSKRKWYLEGIAWTAPAIDKSGLIYVSSRNSYEFNAIYPDGTVKWTYDKSDNYTSGTPAIGDDGTIYTGASVYEIYKWQPYLLALNPDGTFKWASDIFPAELSQITLSADGIIYLSSIDGNLYAVYSSSNGFADSSWAMYYRDPAHTGNVNSPVYNNQTLTGDYDEDDDVDGRDLYHHAHEGTEIVLEAFGLNFGKVK